MTADRGAAADLGPGHAAQAVEVAGAHHRAERGEVVEAGVQIFDTGRRLEKEAVAAGAEACLDPPAIAVAIDARVVAGGNAVDVGIDEVVLEQAVQEEAAGREAGIGSDVPYRIGYAIGRAVEPQVRRKVTASQPGDDRRSAVRDDVKADLPAEEVLIVAKVERLREAKAVVADRPVDAGRGPLEFQP